MGELPMFDMGDHDIIIKLIWWFVDKCTLLLIDGQRVYEALFHLCQLSFYELCK